jgi:hypothetical protein
MEERVKEMENAMQEHENELAFQKEMVEQAQHIHYQHRMVLTAKANKLQKMYKWVQIEVRKLQL